MKAVSRSLFNVHIHHKWLLEVQWTRQPDVFIQQQRVCCVFFSLKRGGSLGVILACTMLCLHNLTHVQQQQQRNINIFFFPYIIQPSMYVYIHEYFINKVPPTPPFNFTREYHAYPFFYILFYTVHDFALSVSDTLPTTLRSFRHLPTTLRSFRHPPYHTSFFQIPSATTLRSFRHPPYQSFILSDTLPTTFCSFRHPPY